MRAIHFNGRNLEYVFSIIIKRFMYKMNNLEWKIFCFLIINLDDSIGANCSNTVYSEFQKGTGLSKNSIVKGIHGLINNGYIERMKTGFGLSPSIYKIGSVVMNELL